MKRLVSRNLPTQFARQLSSLLEKRVEGVLVTHLSQHVVVSCWIEEFNRAIACWVSRKDANSF
jgi:hypothetical protein